MTNLGGKRRARSRPDRQVRERGDIPSSMNLFISTAVCAWKRELTTLIGIRADPNYPIMRQSVTAIGTARVWMHSFLLPTKSCEGNNGAKSASGKPIGVSATIPLSPQEDRASGEMSRWRCHRQGLLNSTHRRVLRPQQSLGVGTKIWNPFCTSLDCSGQTSESLLRMGKGAYKFRGIPMSIIQELQFWLSR